MRDVIWFSKRLPSIKVQSKYVAFHNGQRSMACQTSNMWKALMLYLLFHLSFKWIYCAYTEFKCFGSPDFFLGGGLWPTYGPQKKL